MIPSVLGHGIGEYFHGLPDIYHIGKYQYSTLLKIVSGISTTNSDNGVSTIVSVWVSLCDSFPQVSLLLKNLLEP